MSLDDNDFGTSRNGLIEEKAGKQSIKEILK